MDNSEIYVDMCRKAWEIQDHELVEADYFYDGVRVDSFCSEYDYYKEGNVWLPRQDQLQELALGKYEEFNYHYALEKFRKEAWGSDFSALDYTSMEQLWLAVLMKKKYSKFWNGKDWQNYD